MAHLAELPGHSARTARARAVIDLADFAYVVFVFLIASDAFAYLGLHSVLWLLAYAYALLRIAMTFPTYLATVRSNWVFLLYPALCLVSVLWSDIPRETLRFAVQLTMSTAIAVFIGMRFTLLQIFAALSAVLAFTMLASVANLTGALTQAYDHRGNFEGIFISKNALGHRAVLFVATCLFAIFLIPRLPAVVRVALAGALLATVFMISISGSATATGLGGFLCLLGAGLWFGLTKRGGWAFAVAFAAPGLAALVVVVLGLGLNPLTAMLELLGRDATLTGRTVLWDFAIRHLDDRPALGFGASGFWNHPRFQNEIAVLQSQYGEGVGGFHNIWLELLIMLGPLGLLFHSAMVGATIFRATYLARRTDDVLIVWAATLTIGMYAMAIVMPQLFQQHAIPLILVVAFGVTLALPQRRTKTLPS